MLHVLWVLSNQTELVFVPLGGSARYGSIDCTAISHSPNFALISRDRIASKQIPSLLSLNTDVLKVVPKEFPGGCSMSLTALQLLFQIKQTLFLRCYRGDVGFLCGIRREILSFLMQNLCSSIPLRLSFCWVLCWIIDVMLTWLFEYMRCDGSIRICALLKQCLLYSQCCFAFDDSFVSSYDMFAIFSKVWLLFLFICKTEAKAF